MVSKDDSLVHIRYFAVRNKDGKYLGTLEVTEVITDIEEIEGEKDFWNGKIEPWQQRKEIKSRSRKSNVTFGETIGVNSRGT